jgi:hypothetical protein
MATCASCGGSVADRSGLCPHHVRVEVGWAEANRIMCNFVHRKVSPRRPGPDPRDSDFWLHVEAACLASAFGGGRS